MIITSNTGENKSHEICKCGNDYGGDRIILEDSTFIPILGGERGCGLDLSGWFKNVSQVNNIKFKLNPKQTKIVQSLDDQGVKFLAISVTDPTKPIYWRKVLDSPFYEKITAILDASWKITTLPFTSDRVNAEFTLTLNSDNDLKTITWANIGTSFIDGGSTTNWNEGDHTWNDYHPLLTSNTKLIVNDSVTTVPFVIEQADNGDFAGEVTTQVVFGSTVANITFKISGNYPAQEIAIDTIKVVLDGHLVGELFILSGMPVTDFVSTPLSMEAESTFIAASGLIEEYDKIVGLMVLTSTDNEPIAKIKLLNNGTTAVQVQTMIGT